MRAFNTICLIWKTDTEAIPVPVLDWFADEDAARLNAAHVLALICPPDLAECPVTVTAISVPDVAVAEFIRNRPRLRQR